MIVSDHSSARPTDSRQNLTKAGTRPIQRAFVGYCQGVGCWHVFSFPGFSAEKRTSDGHLICAENFSLHISSLPTRPADQSSVGYCSVLEGGAGKSTEPPSPHLQDRHLPSVRQELEYPPSISPFAQTKEMHEMRRDFSTGRKPT